MLEFQLSYKAEDIDKRLGQAGEAITYTPQTLTEEQKTQARENIGAIPMLGNNHSYDGDYLFVSGEFEDAEQVVNKGYVDNAVKGKAYELIETVTLTEDVAQIERTQEPNGTPYRFERILTKVANNSDSLPAYLVSVMCYYGKAKLGHGYLSFGANGKRYGAAEIYKEYGYWRSYTMNPNTNVSQYSGISWGGSNYTLYCNSPYIEKIDITSTTAIQTGTTIEIWGVRADA